MHICRHTCGFMFMYMCTCIHAVLLYQGAPIKPIKETSRLWPWLAAGSQAELENRGLDELCDASDLLQRLLNLLQAQTASATGALHYCIVWYSTLSKPTGGDLALYPGIFGSQDGHDTSPSFVKPIFTPLCIQQMCSVLRHASSAFGRS